MRNALRHPALHFLIAGALLYAARSAFDTPAEPSQRRHIVITAAEVAELRSRDLTGHGTTPSEKQLAAFVDAAINDEILYREAIAGDLDSEDAVVERRLVQGMRFLGNDDGDEALLVRQAHALGLRDGDPVIRRRLIQKMRSSLARQAQIGEPSDAELEAYFETHRIEFAAPPQVRLSHVFFAGPQAAHRAAAVLSELDAAGAAAGRDRGDPFIAGADLPLLTERHLAKLFGPQLAKASLSLPLGDWHGPLESAYGVHLVWIHEKSGASTPALDSVRDSVRRQWRAEKLDAVVNDAVLALRKRYRIEVAQ